MRALKELCACTPSSSARVDEIRKILGADIERYGDASVVLLSEGRASDAALYGCFAARKMLESSCVALLSHLDPARLLILREYQLRSKYDLAVRDPASIDWRKDVLSEEEPNWAKSVSSDKFVRGLLGGHLADVAWTHAIERLSVLPESIKNPARWVSELIEQFEDRKKKKQDEMDQADKKKAATVPPLKETAGDSEIKDGSAQSQSRSKPRVLLTPTIEEMVSRSMLTSFRSVAEGLFSTLSKGVHLEFVIEQAKLFDEQTVVFNIKKSIKFVTQLAFIFHMMDAVNTGITPEQANDFVSQIEEMVDV